MKKSLTLTTAFISAVLSFSFVSCDSLTQAGTSQKDKAPSQEQNTEEFQTFNYDENGEIIMNTNGYAEWAGVRHSSYGDFGYRHDPSDPSDMKEYVDAMKSFYKKNETASATGALIWIVGEVASGKKASCRLNFPEPDGIEIPDGLIFSDEDNNEEFLTVFDNAGYDVWLQVEPGFVDLEKLASLVMTKYRNHKCVKGFGIDTEWYKNTTDGNDGTPLDDLTAQKVDAAVKKVNPAYSVFAKHWDTKFLPPNYRGKNNDMIFVTDSQFFESLEEMKEHYSEWANHYAPNPVFFQIGYYGRDEENENVPDSGMDEKIWKSFDKPLKNFGTEILKSLPENGQKRGIIWVDFSFLDAYDLSR